MCLAGNSCSVMWTSTCQRWGLYGLQTYSPAGIRAYWSRRPVAVVTRVAQLLSEPSKLPMQLVSLSSTQSSPRLAQVVVCIIVTRQWLRSHTTATNVYFEYCKRLQRLSDSQYILQTFHGASSASWAWIFCAASSKTMRCAAGLLNCQTSSIMCLAGL